MAVELRTENFPMVTRKSGHFNSREDTDGCTAPSQLTRAHRHSEFHWSHWDYSHRI